MFLEYIADYISEVFIRVYFSFPWILLMHILYLFTKAIWFCSAYMDALVINNWECWWSYLLVKLLAFFEYVFPSAVSIGFNLFLWVTSCAILRALRRWHACRTGPLAFMLLINLIVRFIGLIARFPQTRELLNNIGCFLPPEYYFSGLWFRRASLQISLSATHVLIKLF